MNEALSGNRLVTYVPYMSFRQAVLTYFVSLRVSLRAQTVATAA